jgi:hypothetical protein
MDAIVASLPIGTSITCENGHPICVTVKEIRLHTPVDAMALDGFAAEQHRPVPEQAMDDERCAKCGALWFDSELGSMHTEPYGWWPNRQIAVRTSGENGMLRGSLPLVVLVALAVLAIAVWSTARAQTWPHGVSDKVTTATLSVTSGNCLGVNTQRKTLALDNIAGTINIGYCETSAATPNTPCTAAIGTAGTTTLLAGALHYFVPAPVNQFCFIAASATPSLTIREGQ